jgi:hypothetical protein
MPQQNNKNDIKILVCMEDELECIEKEVALQIHGMKSPKSQLVFTKNGRESKDYFLSDE